MKINPENDNIYSLYVNIGGKSNMKVLRVIGAFFAKIGRWIASTAWVQPLLIVGGIFGIIFSIPYIKKGIEGLQVDNTDYKYEYYKERSLGLSENGKADKLLTYLENFSAEDQKSIEKEFGSQFLLAFVQKKCQNCKDGVAGYKYVSSHNSFSNKFKLHTILVDKTNSKGDYLAKKLIEKHADLFDELSGEFGEDCEDYPLYNNKTSIKESYTTKVKAFSGSTLSDGEGFETPTIFMVDLKGADNNYSYHGITQIVFNYIDLIDDSLSVNSVTKGNVLRDMWTYKGIFDPEYIHD